MTASGYAGSERVVRTPELLAIIFSHLERLHVVGCACVCRQWSEIALDFLWRNVTDQGTLFSILAPLQSEKPPTFEFARLPTPLDWARFYTYARRVRVFTCDRTGKTGPTLASSGWDDLARTRTDIAIFPRLHQLVWTMLGPQCFRTLIPFMQPSVEHLTLKLPVNRTYEAREPTLPVYPYPSFLENIALRMPALTGLDLRAGQNWPISRGVGPGLYDAVGKMFNLEKLIVPIYWFTTQLAEELSRLPKLKVIQYEQFEEQGSGLPEDVRNFAPVLAAGAFPMLWDLSLAVRLQDMSAFVRDAFCPRTVTDMFVQSLERDGADALHALLSALPDAMPRLAHFYMELRPRDRTTVEHEVDLTKDRITLDTLRPLLTCPNLAAFELTHDLPIVLTQSDVEEFASAWGERLKSLMLNPEPFVLEHPQLTLAALVPFAERCPNLENLHLYLDTTLGDVPLADQLVGAPKFTKLESLGVGVSNIADSPGVARALSRVLPEACAVTCGYTWDLTPMPTFFVPDPEAGANINERFPLWGEVDRMLPMLCKLAREEAARTKQLEDQLEDLRTRNGILAEQAKMIGGP